MIIMVTVDSILSNDMMLIWWYDNIDDDDDDDVDDDDDDDDDTDDWWCYLSHDLSGAVFSDRPLFHPQCPCPAQWDIDHSDVDDDADDVYILLTMMTLMMYILLMGPSVLSTMHLSDLMRWPVTESKNVFSLVFVFFTFAVFLSLPLTHIFVLTFGLHGAVKEHQNYQL